MAASVDFPQKVRITHNTAAFYNFTLSEPLFTPDFDRDECYTFEGALDAESINGLDDIIDIGEQLDRYLYIPHVTTHQELGLFLVNHDIKHFDDSVCPYLDYSKIGIEYYSNHGGACTTKGYIVRRDSVEHALTAAVDNRSGQRMEGMKMA
jgi:hypothetical protein